jgi:hypothetical protein
VTTTTNDRPSRASQDRKAMDAALRQVLVPALRARGFQGSLPHFRRVGGTRLDLLTVQFDKYSGGFVVEIATAPPEGVPHPDGSWIAPDKVTAHSVTRRLRLGAAAEGRDHWFRYDAFLDRFRGDRRFTRLAEQVVSLLDRQAEGWWRDAAPRHAAGGGKGAGS